MAISGCLSKKWLSGFQQWSEWKVEYVHQESYKIRKDVESPTDRDPPIFIFIIFSQPFILSHHSSPFYKRMVSHRGQVTHLIVNLPKRKLQTFGSPLIHPINLTSFRLFIRDTSHVLPPLPQSKFLKPNNTLWLRLAPLRPVFGQQAWAKFVVIIWCLSWLKTTLQFHFIKVITIVNTCCIVLCL